MKTIKEKVKESFKELKEPLKLKNVMEGARIEKVIINAGVGSFSDKKKVDLALDRLGKITGQRPIRKGAKASIAAFKVREGDTVGLSVTLRGEKMWSFLDKLVNIALPRAKDFHGIPLSGADQMGNYTLGLREHIVFPETADEELKDVFGFGITIVTNQDSKEKAITFLKSVGFPFTKAK
jgi:large subunit ribosomal protein L5